MAIAALLAELDLDPATADAIRDFVERKAAARELGMGRRVAAFDALIEHELHAARPLLTSEGQRPHSDDLARADTTFLALLDRYG